MSEELYECRSCSAKPGSPSLCATCLENRKRAGSAWIGPRRREPTAYDRDQQALRDRVFKLECQDEVLLKRLNKALARIEALELEVAKLTAPREPVPEPPAHDSKLLLKLPESDGLIHRSDVFRADVVDMAIKVADTAYPPPKAEP